MGGCGWSCDCGEMLLVCGLVCWVGCGSALLSENRCDEREWSDDCIDYVILKFNKASTTHMYTHKICVPNNKTSDLGGGDGALDVLAGAGAFLLRTWGDVLPRSFAGKLCVLRARCIPCLCDGVTGELGEPSVLLTFKPWLGLFLFPDKRTSDDDGGMEGGGGGFLLPNERASKDGTTG